MTTTARMSRQRVRAVRRAARILGGTLLALAVVQPWLPVSLLDLVEVLLLLTAVIVFVAFRELELRGSISLVEGWKALWGPPGAWTWYRAQTRPQPRQLHMALRAADRGLVEAQAAAGGMLWRGVSGVKDPEGACRLWLKAAAHGHPGAAAGLADACQWGLGMPHDPGQAAQWRAQAEAWQPKGWQPRETPFILLVFLRLLRGGRRIMERFWVRRHAEGHLGRTLLLVMGLTGLMLLYSSFGNQMAILLRLALFLALLTPFFWVFTHWISGDRMGAVLDVRRASRLRKRAEAGEAKACTELGQVYLTGSATQPPDAVLAREWLSRAVQQGDSDAMVLLADMLSWGRGGARDLPGARQLLQRARAAGHPEAAPRLARIPSA